MLNNLLDGLNGKAAGSLTAEEKEARSNLISSIVAGTTAATGGGTAVAAIAAKLETENNALALPFLLPGIPGKPQVMPLPGLPGYDKTERELGLEPRGFAEQLVKLGKGLEGIPLTPAGWAQYLIENLGGAVRVYDPNSYAKGDSASEAQDWSKKGRIKNAGLPTKGKIRYVPSDGYNPSSQLPRGPNNGYMDKFDNEWVKGPSRTQGQAFERDVQFSKKEKLNSDGPHVIDRI